MATLRYSQIRSHPGKTIQYIANKDKVISTKTHDIYNVLNYMGEENSTERVYSFARHCSNNPNLAEKEIALHRARYYEAKSGGVQGLKEDASELMGLHFFFSYTEEDDPSEAIMNEIGMKLAEHPLFRDFAVFGANHFDKKHRHTHFFVSAYSAEGKPRKVCMRHRDYNEIRRYANKLCVEHGLSIIDLSALRWKNPEYSAWIDGVIASGKVTVHPETNEHKKRPKQKISTRNLYYKWSKQTEEREEEDLRLLSERQKQKKNFEEKWFYTVDGNEDKRWYKTGDPQHRFYVIPLKDRNGRAYTPIELTVRFVVYVAQHESKYMSTRDINTWMKYEVEVAKDIQGMADCLAAANRINIENINDVKPRIAEIGKKMNYLRQEKKRHEASIAKHEELIQLYDRYTTVRKFVEGVPNPDPADVEEYKNVYAALAQNHILTDSAYMELVRRYNWEKQKVIDYEKRMPELNKQYRDLKRLEALANRPAGVLNDIYAYSALADERARQRGTVDDIIRRAKEKDIEK